MATPRPWTVAPHGPWERLDDRTWCVRGDIPGMSMPLRRTMTVAKRDDGTLVVHSVIALDEARMAELEAFGRPAAMVVPNGWHRLDAHAWKARHPALKVYCPPGARKQVEAVVPVDGALEDLAGGGVRAETYDGFPREGVLIAGGTLAFGDTFMNQPHMPGVGGFFYKLVGASGGPRVHPFMKRMADLKKLKAHLLRLADLPGLARLVPAHGDVVTEDAAGVLRACASSL